MHFQHLHSTGPCPDIFDQSIRKHGSIGVNKAQWDKLGETSALPLQIPQ